MSPLVQGREHALSADPVRSALGAAVRSRAEAVAAQVVADWRRRAGDDVVPDQMTVTMMSSSVALATELVGRWLMYGGKASAAEQEHLARSGRASATDGFSLVHLLGNNLAWRDFAAAAVREAAGEVGADDGLVDDVVAMVRRSCDVSLLQMTEEFEKQQRKLKAALDAERAALAHLALHDPLTGLANRSLLMDRLRHVLTSLRRNDRRCAVLFMDLDDFKEINDRAGHSAGDRVLVAVADQLRRLVRGSDTVARLGGDEFVLLLEEEPGGGGSAAEAAARMEEALSHPFVCGGLTVRGSVGVALADGTSDADQVLSAADSAMYARKQRGGPRTG